MSHLPMKLQLLLFYACYSTCSGDRITAGYFHELNISQHKYLTAPTYEINSSASILRHTSLACCQVQKLKPLHLPLHRAPYTSSSKGQVQQCLHCSLHRMHKRVHRTSFSVKIPGKTSCCWCVDGQDKQTARPVH